MERIAPSPDVPDVLRRVTGWLADVADANPHSVPHDFGCGERFFCDRDEHRADGYRRVELRDNGYLLFHCEALELRPSDPGYAERRAGLLP